MTDAQRIADINIFPLPGSTSSVLITIIGKAICGNMGCLGCEFNIHNPNRPVDANIHCTSKIGVLSPYDEERSATIIINSPVPSISSGI